MINSKLSKQTIKIKLLKILPVLQHRKDNLVLNLMHRDKILIKHLLNSNNNNHKQIKMKEKVVREA